MQKEFITKNSKETQKLGEMLAKELRGGKVICLAGELGCGKTTFTQGFLRGLGLKGNFVSPTFLIMKQYHIAHNIKHGTKNTKKLHVPCSMLHDVYHLDAYRVNSQDILSLGWEEIIDTPENIIIIEWADKVCDIIPKGALWISFEWKDENIRKITFKNS